LFKIRFLACVEPNHFAGALPKLNVLTINKLYRLFRGFSIIGAFEWN
jgi:hypothetical protein